MVHPNPGHSEFKIDLMAHAIEKVSVGIFDIQGRMIKTLYSGLITAGTTSLSWDATNQRGATVPDGLYFVRILTKDTVMNRKLILQR